MEQKEWESLKDAMAVEAFVIDAADLMIPAREARERVHAIKIHSDRNLNQGAVAVQNWRGLQHHMGNALIALERLGYTVTKKEST